MGFFKKKSHTPPPPPPKKSKFPWLLLIGVGVWSWFVWDSLQPRLPTASDPLKLYSNQCQQDLRSILLSAVQGASHSIHLVMFGLSDRPMLHALSRKIQDNVPTHVYYDTGGSPNLLRYLEGGDLHPIKKGGLMHQKILVLDDERIFIGSANMTSASLRMHDNLVIGLLSKPLAKFLQEHEPYSPGYFKTKVGGQEVELWLLPDPRGSALTDLRKKIRNAQKSIRIALFTFTHPGLVEELIAAKHRGVAVSVVLDMHSGLGASSKVVESLKQGNVLVRLSQGVGLLHHKFICIDDETLITGSANWTKAAFYKNSDCILAIHHLNKEQRAFLHNLWRSYAVP